MANFAFSLTRKLKETEADQLIWEQAQETGKLARPTLLTLSQDTLDRQLLEIVVLYSKTETSTLDEQKKQLEKDKLLKRIIYLTEKGASGIATIALTYVVYQELPVQEAKASPPPAQETKGFPAPTSSLATQLSLTPSETVAELKTNAPLPPHQAILEKLRKIDPQVVEKLPAIRLALFENFETDIQAVFKYIVDQLKNETATDERSTVNLWTEMFCNIIKVPEVGIFGQVKQVSFLFESTSSNRLQVAHRLTQFLETKDEKQTEEFYRNLPDHNDDFAFYVVNGLVCNCSLRLAYFPLLVHIKLNRIIHQLMTHYSNDRDYQKFFSHTVGIILINIKPPVEALYPVMRRVLQALYNIYPIETQAQTDLIKLMDYGVNPWKEFKLFCDYLFTEPGKPDWKPYLQFTKTKLATLCDCFTNPHNVAEFKKMACTPINIGLVKYELPVVLHEVLRLVMQTLLSNKVATVIINYKKIIKLAQGKVVEAQKAAVIPQDAKAENKQAVGNQFPCLWIFQAIAEQDDSLLVLHGAVNSRVQTCIQRAVPSFPDALFGVIFDYLWERPEVPKITSAEPDSDDEQPDPTSAAPTTGNPAVNGSGGTSPQQRPG